MRLRRCLAGGALALSATSAFGAVSGRVLSVEARPVAGATVVIYEQETAEARAVRLVAGRRRKVLASGRSGAEGTFELESSAPVGAIEVQAEGFAPRALTAADGDIVTVELKAAKTRRGMITANGRPIADATVVWSSADDAGGSSVEILVKSAKDGAYDVPDPDVWASGLVIVHPDFAILEAAPDTRRWPAALGQELSAGVPIEGSAVEESGGRPVSGADVWVGGWPVGKASEPGTLLVPHAPTGWQSILARTGTLVGTAQPGPGKVVIRMQAARSLSGFVRDAKTHAPLGGAVVSLESDRGNGPMTATSDGRGRYAFSALAAGRYGASVVRAGYAPPASDGEGVEVVDLRKSLARQRDFALARLRRLAGRVQDEEHLPIENALVTLAGKGSPTVYATGDVFEAGSSAARTAADGTFTVTIPSDDLAGRGDDALDMPLLVLKEGYAASRVEPVKLAAGRPLVVTLGKGIAMTGRVTAADGTPISGVAVVIAEDAVMPGSQVPVHSALGRFQGEGWVKSRPDGRFVARVQPTVHDLLFRKEGYAPRVAAGHDAAGGESLDVVLDRAAAVRGRVLSSDGSGVPDVLIYVSQPSREVPPGRTDSDGAFAIDDLTPGHYQLYAAKEGTGIHEMRTGEAPASDVRIELGPMGMIRGRVVDAKTHAPMTRFDVMIEGGAEGSRQGQTAAQKTVSDALGAFLIGDVPIGEVAVAVQAEGYLRKRVESLVTPSGEEPADLEIALDMGVAVHGRVTTRAGQPLADVGVTAENSDEPGTPAESDENGEYELAGLHPGTVTLAFRRTGYVTLRKSFNTTETTRADATLSRGLSLKGVVLSNGVGVARAQVSASSRAADAEYGSATTNESGAFSIDGLVAGHYTVEASSDDQGEATLENVDAEKAGPLRLVLEGTPTAVLSGMVTGLPPGRSGLTAMVLATGENQKTAQAPVDATGTFRMEKAPSGLVKVQGYATLLSGATRSSRPNELTLTPGSDNQTVIEFRSDVVIAGTVTRDGGSVAGASISFEGADGDKGMAAARLEGDGQYEIVGVEPGPYTINVHGTGFAYSTEYVVTESAQFDIDVTGAGIRGRAVDAAGGAPIPGVGISLWRVGADNTPAASQSTNERGEFAARSLREGCYRVLTSKKGYGQQVRELDLASGTTSEVAFELVSADGLSLTVVDARDQRPLDAIVVVRDEAKRIVANQHSGVGADGALTIALARGQYVLSTSATGYGTVTMPVTAPGKGLSIGLTPGGTLMVESTRDLRGRIRLLKPDGEEYVRCWCNGIADIQLTGRRTNVANITPGRYAIELVDHRGAATGGPPVVIQEGEVSTVRID